MSEDCLSLNVWAPARSDSKPVVVWFAGGAFLTGGTCIETYDGSRLAAEHDVVVVSANYRMGALGFLWVPGGDANCGLRDQQAAIEWVRTNISAFGGDPANITVVGESAGAGALLHLLASAPGLGPARRCILQSPGVDHTLTAADAESVRAEMLRQLDLSADGADSLRELRELRELSTLPADALLDAQEKALVNLMGSVSSMPFHPYVDGEFLTAKPSVALDRGAGKSVELLISWTADEMRLYPNVSANEGGPERLARWTRKLITRRLGHDPGPHRASDVVAYYFDRLRGTDRNSAADVWAAIQTDAVMRLPARRIADAHAARGGVTYGAQFDWGASGDRGAGSWDRGAFHAIDLPFTFGTLDRCGWREFLGAGPTADEVAAWHMAAWARFARDGDPSIAGQPDWPRYTVQDRLTMHLDHPGWVEADPLADAADVWADLWSPEGGPPA